MSNERASPAALSRRSVLAGLGLGGAFALGGCSSGAAPATYDLAAPRDGITSGRGKGLIVIAEPQALQALDSNRVVVMTRGGGIAYLPDVQLSDRLPKLFQVRLIQTFENASRIQAVGRPGDRLLPVAQINSEIRAFGIDEASGEALAEISVKIVNDRSGRILAGHVFTSRVPAGGSAVAALDLANQALMRDIVKWVSARI
ncbi:MAG: ABC-type transport auxiliary lipoprotein family protein [Proteobacteria bacterium]|nr:ABC-type transport auxiliary lipoprotein family protein [Pseudomonadota bacterium]